MGIESRLDQLEDRVKRLEAFHKIKAKEVIYVTALNLVSAKEYAKKNKWTMHDWKYVWDVEHIRGLGGLIVHVLGGTDPKILEALTRGNHVVLRV